MIATADVVVVGSGAFGASAAYHLARRGVRVAEHRGGLPTLTMDDRYLAGPLPGVDGAWVMSGCCVGGLSVSPALGEAIAEWIVDGAPALDLSDVSPARFAGRDVDEAELRKRCRRTYATHYRASAGPPATE